MDLNKSTSKDQFHFCWEEEKGTKVFQDQSRDKARRDNVRNNEVLTTRASRPWRKENTTNTEQPTPGGERPIAKHRGGIFCYRQWEPVGASFPNTNTAQLSESHSSLQSDLSFTQTEMLLCGETIVRLFFSQSAEALRYLKNFITYIRLIVYHKYLTSQSQGRNQFCLIVKMNCWIKHHLYRTHRATILFSDTTIPEIYTAESTEMISGVLSTTRYKGK